MRSLSQCHPEDSTVEVLGQQFCFILQQL